MLIKSLIFEVKKNLRLLFIFFSMAFMGLSLTTLFSNDEATLELSPECVEQGKIRDELFNEKIMADIIAGFKLDIDDSYGKFTIGDIDAAHLLYGGREDDPYYLSLAKLFHDIDVSTRGTPRLFVRPLHAYFLYKETTNKNVVVRLELEKDRWVVVEEKRMNGEAISYEQLKCEKDYLKKRNQLK
jgi:hypothetical protein